MKGGRSPLPTAVKRVRTLNRMKKVFVDGSAGTTGLQIVERLAQRTDLTLLSISEEDRKNIAVRKELMNQADIVFLCLPDDAAVEAVDLIENPDTCVIDTSTAHRTAPGWVYGFPELGNSEQIAASKRIANPGCHATGFISIVYPLISMGILPKDAALTCFSLTGYSGGGKSMIAEYESAERPPLFSAPALYGLKQDHKHVPEMKAVCGLEITPVFCPIVDDYYKGMSTTVPFRFTQFCSQQSVTSIREALADFYADYRLVNVLPEKITSIIPKIFGNVKAGSDGLELIAIGNEEIMTVTAVFDNLGKGASGAAIQNMNLVLGIDPTTGLN